jgi:hypothetical protein
VKLLDVNDWCARSELNEPSLRELYSAGDRAVLVDSMNGGQQLVDVTKQKDQLPVGIGSIELMCSKWLYARHLYRARPIMVIFGTLDRLSSWGEAFFWRAELFCFWV